MRITTLADKVLEEINARTYSVFFKASREYSPLIDIKDTESIYVVVIPSDSEAASVSRSNIYRDVTIDIAVQKKLSKQFDNSEIDPLMSLTEEIQESLVNLRFDNSIWKSTAFKTIFYQPHLQQNNQFTSVFSVTFRCY